MIYLSEVRIVCFADGVELRTQHHWIRFVFLRCLSLVTRGIAIHQILLGWKTHENYYETDELPNPRPTQPEKI